MKFTVNYKEKLYFGIMVSVSFLIYLAFALYMTYMLFDVLSRILSRDTSSLYFFYMALRIIFQKVLWLFIIIYIIRLFSSLFFIGYIKGNAIKVSKKQFPDIFEILQNHSQTLDLDQTPDMYVLQGNGVLNAFAVRILRKNVVILHSDIFEMAYEEGKDAVSFIIGHELGHIKRNHVSFIKSMLIFPAKFIPLLNTAYSRACEYTCDNIGYNLSCKGAISGLLILAAGKKLYKKVNILNLIHNAEDSSGFAVWLSELFLTHPHLIKRLSAIGKLHSDNVEVDYVDFMKRFKPPEIQK